MTMAAVAVSASVFAQGTAIVPNKAGDNIYIGANFGVSTPLKGYKVRLALRGSTPRWVVISTEASNLV